MTPDSTSFSCVTQFMICFALCITSSIILLWLRHIGVRRKPLFQRIIAWIRKSPRNISSLKALASGYMLLFCLAGFITYPRQSFPWIVCLAVIGLNYAKIMEQILDQIERHRMISFVLPGILMAIGLSLPWLLGVSFVFDVLTLLTWYIHQSTRSLTNVEPKNINNEQTGIKEKPQDCGTSSEEES